MKEILYIEVPTPDTDAVRHWLRETFAPDRGEKIPTPDGFRLRLAGCDRELSTFVWSLQRTTYLKVFRDASQPLKGERAIVRQLARELRARFPNQHPAPPKIDLSQQNAFDALEPYYPQTVKYFRKMPKGEYDLARVYWWEQRWRESICNPRQPKQVIFFDPHASTVPQYDAIYVGGALGAIHGAVMARLGYKVLLIERLAFGRMNREWNISREEFQRLIDLGLFSHSEFERVIAREYQDGFSKFFDANNPPQCKAPVLHTPKVLNIALDTEKLLQLCGEKLKAAGGEIWDETEFVRATAGKDSVAVACRRASRGEEIVTARLLVDAMGTASPIASQLNGGLAFDSVCPTVGASVASGFPPGAWDSRFGDVLFSHGDTSRGRQLIWELFPGRGEELTIYLFHYHQIHSKDPGSLLEMYEDFFSILPEYRRCNTDELVWRKATFGYIPGRFSLGESDRNVAFDRVLSIGDAASLQSPLIFTGFGSLVRNLDRLTALLNVALKHDLLSAKHLNRIRAYQSNVAVTWLFSKGMMVPAGKAIAPQKINAMLNTFFGLLASEPPEVADNFIKDRTDWLTFNRLALKAARSNPMLLLWIWELAGARDLLRWLLSYFSFTLHAIAAWLFGWLPAFAQWVQPVCETRFPGLWLWLLAKSYSLTAGLGKKGKVAWRSPTTTPKTAGG